MNENSGPGNRLQETTTPHKEEVIMVAFYVNNQLYQVEGDSRLLPFLRDVCKCKSVKDGCSEGACGT